MATRQYKLPSLRVLEVSSRVTFAMSASVTRKILCSNTSVPFNTFSTSIEALDIVTFKFGMKATLNLDFGVGPSITFLSRSISIPCVTVTEWVNPI